MELNVSESKPSIKLSKNSAGQHWEVKVYSDDINKCLSEVTKINEELKKRYPNENKHVPKS